MMRLIWVEGRLPWPLVIVVVYVSALMIIFDLCWRLLVIPFDTLVVDTLGIAGLCAVVIGLLIWRHSRIARIKRI